MRTTITIDADVAYELQELLEDLIGLCRSGTGRLEPVLGCSSSWACGPEEPEEDCKRLPEANMGAIR